MKTFVLPGFSERNKDWVKEIAKVIPDAEIIEWKHWTTQNPKDFSSFNEAQKVIEKAGNSPFNIIAKSLGTLVAMHAISKHSVYLRKLILCGIPLRDMDGGNLKLYEVLSQIPAHNVKVIQNEFDNHGTQREVRKFIKSISQQLEVEPQPRSDHDYPYFEEFKEFLNSEE